MRRIIPIIISMIFFCFTLFAQSKIPSDKVAAVNFDSLFDENTGIKDLADEYKKLDEEIKVLRREIEVFSIQIESEKTQILNIQNNPQLVRYKLEKLEAMSLDRNRRQELIDYRFKQYKKSLMLKFKVYEALRQFKKEKGYEIIIDSSLMNESLIIMGENEMPSNKTSEFIRFYNKIFLTPDSQ